MAAKYLPLMKMEELEENISLLDKNLEYLYKFGFPRMKSYNEYIQFLLELYVLDIDVKEADIAFKAIMAAFGETFQTFGVFEKDYNSPTQVVAEIFDYILEPYVLNVWRLNKQVYKPDNDFCNALLKTENLVITKDMLKHLPCKHFYIDLNDCSLFNPIKGIFVNVFLHHNSDKASLVFYLMDEEGTTWSSYDILDFGKEAEVKIRCMMLEFVLVSPSDNKRNNITAIQYLQSI